MKRHSKIQLGFAGVAVIALLAGVPYAGAQEPSAKHQAPSAASEPVQLALAAEKKTTALDQQGKKVVVWQAIDGEPIGRPPGRLPAEQTRVKPADVVRYTVIARNNGEAPVKDLAVTQPVPLGTRFVLDSAKTQPEHAPVMTYSIDNGRTFTAQPKIEVKLPNGQVELRPAPAERYTHVRWTLTRALDPAAPAKLSYLVRVK